MSKQSVLRHQVQQVAKAILDASDQNFRITVFFDKLLGMEMIVDVKKTYSGVTGTGVEVSYYMTTKYGNTARTTPIKAHLYHTLQGTATCIEVELPDHEHRPARTFFKAVALELKLDTPDVVEWRQT